MNSLTYNPEDKYRLSSLSGTEQKLQFSSLAGSALGSFLGLWQTEHENLLMSSTLLSGAHYKENNVKEPGMYNER